MLLNNITFSPEGWADYLYWQKEDKKMLERINRLITDAMRNGPASGIGKPEALRHIKGWSRRIDDGNRLAYTVENGALIILSCLGHYGDH